MLPLVVSETLVAELALEAGPGEPAAIFEVDLAHDVVRTPSGATIPIALPRIRRTALLEGLDEIDLTLQRDAEIDRFERRAGEAAPWLYRMRAGTPADARHPNAR
jgi:3-isopropylmalate/(R)-2-methylmalate dehydratase small subunit